MVGSASRRGERFRRLFGMLVAPTRRGHLGELGSSLGSPEKWVEGWFSALEVGWPKWRERREEGDVWRKKEKTRVEGVVGCFL